MKCALPGATALLQRTGMARAARVQLTWNKQKFTNMRQRSKDYGPQVWEPRTDRQDVLYESRSQSTTRVPTISGTADTSPQYVGATKKRPKALFDFLGWLMGLEPTTTGITILTLYYFIVLIDADRIHTNQQLTTIFCELKLPMR